MHTVPNGKQIQPRVFQLYGAHSFYFAWIELKFGSHDRWVILWAWLMVENGKFIISRFLVVIFLEIQMLRLAIFVRNVVFLCGELTVGTNCCF